jgi:hypothetical protein
VKSCNRVPTANTRSASWASALAAAVPVTPTAPMLSGCASGSADLPAWVSPSGRSCASQKPRKASSASP